MSGRVLLKDILKGDADAVLLIQDGVLAPDIHCYIVQELKEQWVIQEALWSKHCG